MLSRTKEMYFTDETRQMLEENRKQYPHLSESEYLELLIRREYQNENPGVFCEKIEETAQEIFSAVADLQKLLSKETLVGEAGIENPIECIKRETEELQQYSKE